MRERLTVSSLVKIPWVGLNSSAKKNNPETTNTIDAPDGTFK
jgi:hypothetical protein